MKWDPKKNTYSLSPRDLQVIAQAKVGFQELTDRNSNHPELPPLWSKMAYVMAYHHKGTSAAYFWKHYREDSHIAAHAEAYYYRTYIPKATEGMRELMVPHYALRWHQQFILRNILDKLPVSPYACAYKKGVGLVDMAQPHIGKPVLLHLDLKDFFHSISRNLVFECLLRETGYPKSVCGFLTDFCCYRGHLPQGACTSPALSNLCFKQCDEKIAQLAAENHLTYTRYSDDIFLSGDIQDPKYLQEQVREILKLYGFRLNQAKTKVLQQHQAQRVASVTVNEKLQVNRRYRRDLRQELHYLKLYGEDAKGAKEADSYLSYLHQILGKVSFVLYVDPQNQEFLKAKSFLTQKIEALYLCQPPKDPPAWAKYYY